MAAKSSSSHSLSDILKTERLYLSERVKVFNDSKKVSGEKTSITTASWNVKIASYNTNVSKIHTIASVINKISPDIIALQEVASPGDETIRQILSKLPGNWNFQHNTSRRGGNVCLAFLWNTDTIQEEGTRGSLITPPGYFRGIFYKTFVAKGKFNFKLVNFHLRRLDEKEHITEIDNLHQVYERMKIKKYTVIFIGDINEYPCNDHLKELMYENIIRPHQRTNVSGKHCLDNMIVPYSLYLCCDEHSVKKDFIRECSNPCCAEKKAKIDFKEEDLDHYPIVTKFSTPPNHE